MTKFPLNALACLAAAALLAGCGGGGGSDGGGSTAGTTEQTTGVTVYASILNQLGTLTGLNSTAVAAAFDDAYLDSGMTKKQVLDALGGEAAAMAAAADHSLFPQVTLTDAQVSNCDSKNVCTLTATITNGDVDTTAVQFSTKVLNVNGTYRLLGDQLAS
ncbi:MULTISPECIES: hypothetical protein [Ramlibacter]|uniref:Nuclear transport factor 2 family protein n=1 Tax=Ramlibacter pinisoli TaxID=2682844 RepID=A0A6N8J075_9BURK|nr:MULTISPECIES: hypothetical protein [Ramlibacter]MBA2961727.1 hypothetical protein [Ramlibacter sp. CGMCC 1.13660]MVQ31670.1 hypothetical protein [Ramlibacter pinisoli]